MITIIVKGIFFFLLSTSISFFFFPIHPNISLDKTPLRPILMAGNTISQQSCYLNGIFILVSYSCPEYSSLTTKTKFCMSLHEHKLELNSKNFICVEGRDKSFGVL